MHNPGETNKTIVLLLLLMLAFCAFFFRLGDMALLDWDEPRYADSAREMIASHNWLIPYFNNEVRLNKPVLFYWFIISAYKVFGVNEFSARLWSAVFGILGVGLTYLFGKKIFTTRVGLISSLVLATSILYVVMARAATPDMTLTFFITASLVSFFLAYTHKAGKKTCSLICILSLSLGVLTKGPVGFIIPALTITIFLLLTKNVKKIFTTHLLWEALLFLAITLPWYIYAYYFLAFQHTSQLAFNETIGRFFLGYAHPKPLYYYIPILCSAFFPWSCFLPFSIKDLFSKGWNNLITENQHSLFVLIWFSTVFFFFSLCKCKLGNYILPIAPACALLTGIFWDKYLDVPIDSAFLRYFKKALLTLVVSSIAMGITVLIAVGIKFHDFLTQGMVLFIIFSGFSLISFKAFLTQKRWSAFMVIPLSIVIAFLISIHYASPEIENRFSTKSLVTVTNQSQEIKVLYNYRRRYPSSVFYSKVPVRVIKNNEEVLNLLNSGKNEFCIIAKRRWNKFKDKLPSSITILKETKTLLLVMNKAEMVNTQSYAEDED